MRMNAQNNTLLAAALKYAERGIPVFPIIPVGKVPAVKWGTEATTNSDVITGWWNKNPSYNIGLVTGQKSGITVVDFDTDEAWAFGIKQGLPNAPTVKTAKGYHVYCRSQDGVRNFQKRSDLPGIDLRGEGGYVVASPSIHETEAIYTWVSGKGLDDLPFGKLPEWLFPKIEEANFKDIIKGVSEGSRNNCLTQLVGRWIFLKHSYEEAVDYALKWNDRNIPPLPEKEVIATLNSIWKKEYGSLPKLDDEWEKPILFDGINAPDISANLLPSWLGEYAQAVSQSTQSPEALAVMMGLSTVAASVQKRFEVSPFGDGYNETLSIWTVTVLPPSERKTPVVSAMTAPLINWETEQAALLEEQIIETKTKIAVDERRIAKLEKQAADAEEDAARTEIIRQITEIRANTPVTIYPPKLWTGDTTVERLQDLLVENGERMSVIADEGGIFEIMAGLYNDGKVNIDVFLQGYSGMQVRVERKTRSVTLRRPAVSFGLTVQPSIIESFSHGGKKAFKGKGALARFLFCHPKSMLGNRIISERVQIPEDLKIRYETGVKTLLSIEKQVDELGVEVPRILRLAPDALAQWMEFSQQIETMLGFDGELSALNDWGGKLPGTVLRIAGLTHLAEHGPNNLLISRETISSSITLCTLLKEHAKTAYGMIGADAGLNGAKKVFEWMKRRNFEVFTKNTCHSALKSSFPAAEELDRSLKVLIGRNIIKLNIVSTAGRPAQTYICNPKLRADNGIS